MLELVARALGLTIPAAFREINSKAIPLPDEILTSKMINRYIADHPKKRQQINEFWAKAMKYLLRSTSQPLAGLRSHFRVHTHLPESRWASGPGHLVGALPVSTIQQFFEPSYEKYAYKGRRLFPGGRSWTDALVVPYYSGPDRICAFLFVGRNGQPQDMVFQPVKFAPALESSTEAGLAGVPSLAMCRPVFGEYAIVFDDPFLAARLQIRYAATSNDLLPLLAFRDGPKLRTTHNAYVPLNKHPLFFGFQLTPQIVHQAIWSDGLISVPRMRVEPTQQAIDHYLRDNTPLGLLQNAVSTAKPWASFMKDWSNNTSDHIVEELLSGLEMYGRPTLEKLAAVHTRLDRTTALEPRYPSVCFSRFRVFEKEGKTWAVEPKREPVMVLNGTIKVHKTVIEKTTPGRKPTTHYIGTLTFEGTEIPFKISGRTFDHRNRLLPHLQQLVTTATNGGVLWVAPNWGGLLYAIATAPFQ